MLIMHINKVIILMRYYAYKQSYHTYALLCVIMHINKVIILMHYYAYYAYKQSYYTYALSCLLCV